jgi:hypothetical protein
VVFENPNIYQTGHYPSDRDVAMPRLGNEPNRIQHEIDVLTDWQLSRLCQPAMLNSMSLQSGHKLTYFLNNDIASGCESASCMDVNPCATASLIVTSKYSRSMRSDKGGLGMRLMALSTMIPIYLSAPIKHLETPFTCWFAVGVSHYDSSLHFIRKFAHEL